MKKLLLLLSSVSLPALGQWTVYDPAVHTQQILSTAQEVAKFVEVIGNQVKQLRTLEEDVATLRHYVDLFGAPSQVHPGSEAWLRQDLLRNEVGKTLGTVKSEASALGAMVYDGGGVFAAIGRSFQTPGGTKITRAEPLYRAVAVVEGATENFLVQSANTKERRQALKAEIAGTMTALGAAKTDAEVQKLTGTLVGLHSALASTEQELEQAGASVLVQEAATRTDERRQSEARKEAQAAEFTEALGKYRSTFGLMTGPVAFPTH